MQLLIDTREYRACNRHGKYFNKARIKLEVSILFNSLSLLCDKVLFTKPKRQTDRNFLP